jgi:hypothetical protein
MVVGAVIWLIGMPYLKPDTDAVERVPAGFPVIMPDANPQ